MKIDVQGLGILRELAHNGATQAAESLTELTGVDTHVRVTNISIADENDLEVDLAARDGFCIGVNFTGGLVGQTRLIFDSTDDITAVTDRLRDGSERAASVSDESAIKEVGNIMTSGFIDGWAQYLGKGIEIMPPEITDEIVSTHVEHPPDDTETAHVFLFESRLEGENDFIDFRMYMTPELGSFKDLLTDGDQANKRRIRLEKLLLFNRMTKHGAAAAADNISMMTGIETAVEISRLRFVPIEMVPGHVGDELFVSIVFEYDGIPSGYLAILFDESAACELISVMTADTDDPVEWNELERSAIKELGNIMTSGFIDGWANVLESTINHSPPQFVHDLGSSILSPIAIRMAEQQEFAFLIDSSIKTADGTIGCDILAIPNESDLTTALETLYVGDDIDVRVDPQIVFSE